MATATDRATIANALRAFASQPLEQASAGLFKSLGYSSERTLDFGSISQFLSQFDEGNAILGRFNPLENWLRIKLLFQLTSADIAKGSSQQLSLLDPEPADLRKIESYLFLAIELKNSPDCPARNRTELCDLARAINRLFPMPALILLKEDDRISIAITYRRSNKKDQSKDVVGRKVTLIKDISIRQPHPGHLAILEDFALPTLSAFRGRDIKTFADLDAAWRESLSVELLRRRAYRMLADWYFWAREHAQFPPDAKPDADGKPSLHLIRLLTRVIFCWFVKEKTLPDGRPLIPYDLFDARRIRETLKDATPGACTYYTAVLQNLFFATLNTEMDEAGKPVARRFARKIKEDHMVHTLWRHEDLLCDPSGFTALLRDVPFLNGGLFECLDDRVEIEGSNFTKEIRVDGFSTDPAKQPRLPNFLFFGEEQTADLSEATGSSSRSSVQVAPLLTILNRFVWTITESTPLEEEVALDPDLLGNVFENLLAAYNPETGTVARNATGSFYTPDFVVDWMIDQALQPLLVKALPPKTKNATARVRRLLDWNEPGHDFNAAETSALIEALSKIRALDPACGSGAYPMGFLKKAVRVLSKLDPNNTLWKQKQIDLAEKLESATARDEALAAIERAFARNNDDYGRKLYLIENGLYGVDIQPLAVQIAKLRFFITLIVDQPIDPSRTNYGILPLPNLETKIVAANTLLGLQRGQLLLGSDAVRQLERELKNVRHRYFTARRYQDKKALRKRDRELCKLLAKALVDSGECTPSDAARLVEWNPYNTNVAAGFFDPGWMFGLEGEGGKFDLVVGNPPYVRQEELKAVTVQDSSGKDRPLKEVLKEQYECFTGTADLYVYFFERSLQLLRLGGFLSFITSNKYFRAAYGEKLRAYLLYATAPRVILDFGDTNIFTAVAYPCILVTEKTRVMLKGDLPDPKAFESESMFGQLVEHGDREFSALAWQPGPLPVEFPEVFDQKCFAFKFRDLKPSGWNLEQGVGLSLVSVLKQGRMSLSEYVGTRVFRGITTGFNKAFELSDKQYRDIVDKCQPSEEIIKPYVRGKDIKRWSVEETGKRLIFTRRGIDIAQFPSVKQHLSAFKANLMPGTTGGRKPGSYEWYEIQDNIAYFQEFAKPKIVSTKISIQPTFSFDTTGAYLANTSYFIPVERDALFILGLLNSAVFHAYARRVFVDKQGGWFEVQPTGLEEFPIPAATPEQQQACEALSNALIHLHRPESAAVPERGLMVAYFEQWLNGLVYELFFPGELHARKLHLFEATAKIPLPASGAPDFPAKLQVAFAAAHDLKSSLRAMLADLQTIEEVRIIEGNI